MITGYFTPSINAGGAGGGGSGDVVAASNNIFTGTNQFRTTNLFLRDTTNTVVPTSNGEVALSLSAWGDASPSDYKNLLEVWSYAIDTHPMIYFNSQGSIVTGGSINISNDFVGSLNNDQKAIGPFESTVTPTGAGLAGVATFMLGVRSDVLGAAVQVASMGSGGNWTATSYPMLVGKGASLPNQANSLAYALQFENGGWAFSYGGVTPANLHDASFSANLGVSALPNDIMDFGFLPVGANTLALQLANQGTANANSRSKGFSYCNFVLTNGSLTTVGEISVTQLATPSAPTLTKNGAHTAGATTYTYAIVAKSANGQTLASSTASVINCLATLDASNTISIDFTAVNGAISYDIYRTAGMTTGLIDTLVASNSSVVLSGVGLSTVYRRIDDGSFVGGSETLPTSAAGYRNTTGGIMCGGTLLCQSSNNAGFLTAWRVQNSSGATFDFYEHNGSTDPAIPQTNGARVFARDDTNSLTQLACRFATGTTRIIASENFGNIHLLTTNTTAVGNTTTSATDLMSYTIPANTLNVNGRTVRIKAYGTTANNGAAKTLQFQIGGTDVLNISLTTGQAGRWEIEVNVTRTGSSTQDYVARILECTASLAASKAAIAIGTLTKTDTSTIIAKGIGTATSTNDIVMEFMSVEYLN